MPSITPIKSLLPQQDIQPTGSPKPMMFDIKDKAQLYQLYMPFTQAGGLFIPSPVHHPPGTKMLILLTLPDDKTKKTVSGKVVWITPSNAHLGMASGIGVHFDDNDQNRSLKIQIENQLAGILGKSDAKSFTV